MAEESATLVFGMKLNKKQEEQLDDYFNAGGEDDRVEAESFTCHGDDDDGDDTPVLFIGKSKKETSYGIGGISFVGKEIVTRPEWEGILLAVLQKCGIDKPGKIGWWLVATSE
jgi:hypothetical protein